MTSLFSLIYNLRPGYAKMNELFIKSLYFAILTLYDSCTVYAIPRNHGVRAFENNYIGSPIFEQKVI